MRIWISKNRYKGELWTWNKPPVLFAGFWFSRNVANANAGGKRVDADTLARMGLALPKPGRCICVEKPKWFHVPKSKWGKK